MFHDVNDMSRFLSPGFSLSYNIAMNSSISRAALRRITRVGSSTPSILAPSIRPSSLYLRNTLPPELALCCSRYFSQSKAHGSVARPVVIESQTPANEDSHDRAPVTSSIRNNGSNIASKAVEDKAFADHIKSIVQHIPYTIVVLTTGNPSNPETYRAMTLSSFTTVSMNPIPLATINIKTPSHTLTELLHTRRCTINVLQRNERGITCASTFANPNSSFEAHMQQFDDDSSNTSVAREEVREGGNEKVYGPKLRDGIVYISVDCEVRRTIPVQDHTLVILEIKKASPSGGVNDLKDGEALFYKRRGYDLLTEGLKIRVETDGVT